MPLYVYECQKCGDRVETLQAIGEAPPRKCERCGGKLAKGITTAAFQFRGGGWYADGYASTKPGAASSGESGGDSGGSDSGGSESGGSDAGKSDPKPAESSKPATADKPTKPAPEKKKAKKVAD